MLVKDVLEKHNINLSLSEGILELDFDGEFIDYAIKQYPNRDVLYIFYDKNHDIRITPDKKDKVLAYYSFKEDEDIGKSQFYNPEGFLVADEVAVRNLNIGDD